MINREIYDLQFASRASAHRTLHQTPHKPSPHIAHLTRPTTSSTTSSSACSARFCNRLCLKRSEKVHALLCPTQDPVSVPLLTFARKHVWMALHALAQCTAWLLLAHQQKQGRQRAGMGSRNSEEEGMREDRSVYNALADLGMEGRVKRGWYVSVSAFCAFPDITSSLSCARAFLPFFFSRLHGVEPDRATWQSAHRDFTQAFVTPPDTVQDSLYIALMYDHLGLTQLLLKHGTDPNAGDVDGQTLLHISSSRRRLN